MKKILLGISLIISFSLFAQKPETVYSIAREMKEFSWYETQQRLWKEITGKNPKDGNAWLNYYAATRAMKNLSSGTARENYKTQSSGIVKAVARAMPESFEAYYISYAESGLANGPADLLKAQSLRPDDINILDEMIIHYEISGDKANFDKYATKMYEAGEIASGMLNWAYNALAELDENAVLFTAGDNDTYAAWIVQSVKGFRKDVKIVNTSLIAIDDYRNRIFEEKGYAALDLKSNEESSVEEYDQRSQAIFAHFFHGKHPVFVATTAAPIFIEKWGNELFLTGLAYKYSSTSFDNVSIIKRNYENRYLLDYLKESFSFNIGDNMAKEFNGTYLASMIKLYQLYSKSEDLVNKAKLEELMVRVAEQTGQQNEVFEVLGSSDKPATFLTSVLNIKSLEKNMINLKGNIYMDKYEVTNEDYNKFLSNLQRSGQSDLYSLAVYDSTQWIGKFGEANNAPMQDLYGWHPAYDNYPVVNISWEGAKAYCTWLTKQYNMQRQRKYTQVIFRLPTEQEWRTAAGSGDVKATTPFPNNMVRNSKGSYLGNFQPEKGRFFEDGGFFTVSVSSYFPNESGFYNTFGNAAEMTATKGKAIGGSFFTLFEESTFDKTQVYTGPDPRIGFRIVMEVIEE